MYQSWRIQYFNKSELFRYLVMSTAYRTTTEKIIIMVFCLVYCLMVLLFAMNTSFADNEVIHLDIRSFAAQVEESSVPWLVLFCRQTNTDCQAVMPSYQRAAWLMRRYVKFGYVELQPNRALVYNQRIKSAPTVKLYGYQKRRPTVYQGPKTVRGFSQAVVQLVSDDVKELVRTRLLEQEQTSLVIEMDESAWEGIVDSAESGKIKEDWCVVRYIADCDECKTFAGTLLKLANYFDYSVHFAAIHELAGAPTADTNKYPHIEFVQLRKRSKSRKSATTIIYSTQNEVEDTDYSFEAIKQWMLAMLPDPKLVELTTQGDLAQACLRRRYCVLIAVPQRESCDHTCTETALKSSRAMALRNKHRLAGWTWFEKGLQIHLEKLLTISNPHYPTVYVVDLRRLLLKRLDVQFDAVDSVLDGDVVFGDDASFTERLDINELPYVLQTHYERRKSEL